MTKALATIPTDDALMAKQLSAQYQNAIGGLWQVTLFGAMMLSLRGTLSARGQSGEGIKNWITEHCPEINRATAYRFMAIAEGLKKEFKLGVKFDLFKLLDCAPTALDPKALKIRTGIEEFMEGKSQRQLLFHFACENPKPRGGDTGGRRALAPGEKDANECVAATEFWKIHIQNARLGIHFKSYLKIPKAMRKELIDVQVQLNHLLRESI